MQAQTRVHNADEIVAKRFVEHLERPSFDVAGPALGRGYES
jgi:hypothetical protein